MSYIDKITNKDTGESRVISPAAEAVRVSNENYEGDNLDEVLDEIDEAIKDASEGGYAPPAGGIPKTDLSSDVQASLAKADASASASDLALQSDTIITNVNNALLSKVDKETGKGLSSNDYTNADKAKVDGSVQTISVNGGQAQTPTNGNVNISVEGAVDPSDLFGSDGIHIDSTTGNWFIGETNTGVHAQGAAGTSYTDAELEIGNALNGEGDVLGMSGAMRIKSNLDFVYSKLQALLDALGNIAFWEGKPANLLPQSLDWSVPKKLLSITNNISNSVITRNGEPVSGSISVDQGESVELIIAGTTGYDVTSVTASSGTATSLGNGTFKVVITVNADTTLTLTGTTTTKTYSISYDLTKCAAPTGVTNPTTIQYGDTETVELEANNGYYMPPTLPSGAVTGATVSYSRDSSDIKSAEIELSDAENDVSVGLEAIGMLVKGRTVNMGSPYFYINNVVGDTRETFLVLRSGLNNPCVWGRAHAGSYDQQDMLDYSLIPIPSGATKVSIQCNSGYSYGLTLVNTNGVAQNTVQWVAGSTKTELNLSSYPNATHIAVNFKIGAPNEPGSDPFGDETYENMEIDFQII